MRRPAASIRLLFATLLLAFAGAAWGHAALTKSVPGSREVLEHKPDAIHLKFNEKVEAKFSKVYLEDPSGKQVPLDVPTVPADDPYALHTRLSAGRKWPLATGRYTVRYRVLSQDGHVIERSFVFTYGLPPPKTCGERVSGDASACGHRPAEKTPTTPTP